VVALWLSARPEGCVRAACRLPGASSRPSEDLAWLFLLSVVALAMAASRVASGPTASGRRAFRAGTALLRVGAVLLAAGIAVNATLPGDSPLWWLHDTDSLGRLLPVAGALLTGVGVRRADGPSRGRAGRGPAGGLTTRCSVASVRHPARISGTGDGEAVGGGRPSRSATGRGPDHPLMSHHTPDVA
jgi:hypothetical protein